MARSGLTEKDVFKVCDKLNHEHGDFTLQDIRKALGNKGSCSTIFKHHSNWKITQEFKKEQALKEKTLNNHNQELVSSEEASALREQIEKLSKDLYAVKSQNLLLEKQNNQALKERDVALARFETLEKVNNQLLESYKIIEARYSGFEKQQIKQMMDDLQAVNLATQDKVHEISMQSQDVWLKGKIKLKEAVDANKKLIEENAILKAKSANAEKAAAPLKKQIAHLEKIIQKHVTFEQLQEGAT